MFWCLDCEQDAGPRCLEEHVLCSVKRARGRQTAAVKSCDAGELRALLQQLSLVHSESSALDSAAAGALSWEDTVSALEEELKTRPPHSLSNLQDALHDVLNMMEPEVSVADPRVGTWTGRVKLPAGEMMGPLRLALFRLLLDGHLTRVQSPEDEQVPETELPDDVLLHIFSFLPSRDLLLGPRGVSRRWRELALDTSVWKLRDFSEKSWLCAALRLVKRARSLTLSDHSPLHLWHEAIYSDCVFTALIFNLEGNSDVHRNQLTREIIQRHVKKGLLRSLTLENAGLDDAELMFMAVNAGLTTLSFSLDTDLTYDESYSELSVSLPLESSVTEPKPSLRHLKYEGFELWLIVELLIATHASTLETVDLYFWSAPVSKRVMELLGSCPRLREAKLPKSEDLSLLIGCPLLTSLSLEAVMFRRLLQPVRCFRVMGRQLTKLTIDYFDYEDYDVDDRLIKALKALGSCGECALLELDLRYKFLDEEVLQLPDILAGMRLLHTLVLIPSPSVQFLDALHLGMARKLRILRIVGSCFASSECLFPALYRLVKRMPQLHVTKLRRYHECLDPGECKCCRGELHCRLPPEMVGTEDVYQELCLFGQAPPEREFGSLHSSGSAPFWVCVG